MKAISIERTIHDEPPSLAVVLAVADAIDTDPTELEPLYTTTDPDALDQLFKQTASGPQRFGGRVSFSLEGCRVVVHSDDKVVVTPPEAAERNKRTNGTD